MDGQRARLATRRPDPVPDVPASPPVDDTTDLPDPASTPAERARSWGSPARSTTPLWRDEPGLLPVRWAAALGIGWPLVTVLSMALEPVPADPAAPIPIVIELAGLALLFGLIITAVAAGIRHRGAAVAGVVTGLLSTTFVVACPVSGHHDFGMWWFAELSIVSAMLAVSLVALRRSTR